MKLGQVVVLLAIVLALCVLGLLLRMSESRGAEGADLPRIAALGQFDADLNAQLAQARLSPEPAPPTLEAAARRLDGARQALTQGDSTLAEAPPAVDKPLRAALSALQAKLAQVESYRGQREQFFGALQQLRRNAAGAQAAAAGSRLQPMIQALLDEVLLYCSQSTPANGPKLVNLIAQLKAGAGEWPDAIKRAQLQQVADAAIAVLSARDQEQALSGAALSAPTRNAVEVLNSAYGEYYRAEQSRTRRFRLILVVYSVALLCAFGLIGWRLRHSISALDQANAELLHTNANLEKTVEERTGALRKALADVQRQQAQLVQSEKMASLGQMVAGVAHEINTPLGYARSNIGILRDSLMPLGELIGGYELAIACLQQPDVSAEERARRVQELDELRTAWNPTDDLPSLSALLTDADYGLGQIAELVLGLKDFSRVDRSRSELFNINDGIDTALKICHNQIKDRVEIVRDYAKLPDIVCAPSQLNQVFLNIVTNAGQAIAGPGSIHIRTRVEGEQVEISIRDSGSGMDAQTQARIFEPFFTTKAVGQGTGLGLSIVFRIIEDHGGTIAVNSAPGAGTEFIMRLPKTPPPKPAKEPRAAVDMEA